MNQDHFISKYYELDTPEEPRHFKDENKNEWTEWRLSNGLLHREDGPAMEYHDGSLKVWYKCGLKHRTNGPAVERNGKVEWWRHGQHFRELDDYAKSGGIYDTEEFIMLKLKYG